MLDAPRPTLYAALRFADQIQPHPHHWLWPQRIPLGKLTLLIGDPGLGKSLLVADLAARVSAPHPWPDHATPATQPQYPSPQAQISNLESQISNLKSQIPARQPSSSNHESTISGRRLPAGVILVCPEDSSADTLLPRLIAAQAGLNSICILEGASPTFVSSLGPRASTDSVTPSYPPQLPFLDPEPSAFPLTLPAHAAVLEQAIRALSHPRLVVLDPLHAILSSGARVTPDAVVSCLARIAHNYSVAIVAVAHLAKARSQRMLYRVRGSLTLVAAARSIQLLHADPDDPHRRILSPLKTVYGPPPAPLAFRITPAPRLHWETADPAGARSLAPGLLDLSPDACSALSDACDWLADCLADGPRPVRELLPAARAAGFSTATLRRAKRILAVRSIKPDLRSPWLWSQQQPPDPQGAQF